MVTFTFSKITRSALLSLLIAGSLTQSANSYCLSKETKITAAAVAAFAVPFVSSYIALTQDPQPVLENGNAFEKAVNWYRRVICGVASKKSQKGYLTEVKAHLNNDGTIAFDDNVRIKDVYSDSSGVFGNVISWYEANEKDVKKAVGIGAIPAGLIMGYLTLNTIKEILVQHALKAPYAAEGLAKRTIDAIASNAKNDILAWVPFE